MSPPVEVRISTGDHEGLDPGLAGLLLDYHQQTEAEKGQPVRAVTDLPDRYRREVETPAEAFRGESVLVATDGTRPVGCLVMTQPAADACEVKRLWTMPSARGRGVASLLLAAALERAGALGVEQVRLTVWQWRHGAIALYERLGFERVDSWERREGLVCMALRLPGPGAPSSSVQS